jgi:hypothetical protein
MLDRLKVTAHPDSALVQLMSLDTNNIIRILTTLSLGGLLLGVGMRLTATQVRDALRRSHLGWLLPLNFVAVPLLTLAGIRGFQCRRRLRSAWCC